MIFTQTTQRDYNDELRYQNDAINSMKKEMEELRSKIQKASTNEITTAKRITNLDEEIALVNRFVQSLKNEEKRTRDRILVIEKNIRSKEEELELLRLRYEQRVINTYMQGRLSQLEKVLSSTLTSKLFFLFEFKK